MPHEGGEVVPYRINSLIAHPISFELLKSIFFHLNNNFLDKNHREVYINMVSDFFDNEEFDIDRMDQLTNHYELKKKFINIS